MSKKKTDTDKETSPKKEIQSFGKYLRAEREKKNITLETLYQKTKIQVHFLEALEEDRYENMPVAVLIRGYIRTISEIIDISPDDTVERYDNFIKQAKDNSQQTEKTSSRKQPTNNALEVPLERNFSIAMASTLGIGIIVAIIYFLFPDAPPVDTSEKKDIPTIEKQAPPTEEAPTPAFEEKQEKSEPPAETMQEKPPEAAPEEIAPEKPEENVSNAVVTPLNRPDGVNYLLKFFILDECWVKVKIDDDEPRNFMLRNNTTATFRAKKQIIIDIGRVSSTELIVNGINIELGQPASDVLKELTINDETAEDFIKREKLLDRSKVVPADVMTQRAMKKMEKEREKKEIKAEAEAKRKNEAAAETKKEAEAETGPNNMPAATMPEVQDNGTEGIIIPVTGN